MLAIITGNLIYTEVCSTLYMRRMIIIGPINPFESKISGTRNYVMNFVNSVDLKEKIALFGYTSSENVNKQIRENVEFHPLIIYPQQKKRYFIPQTFKFIFRLYVRRKEILSIGNVLHIQRIDYAIPFLFPVKSGKVIIYFHGAASKGYLSGKGVKSKLKGFIYLILEHLMLSRADKIVTVSQEDERYYFHRYPEIKNKIVTIPIPLNLDDFNIKTDKKALRSKYDLDDKVKIILYAGRFSKVKGIDLIIRAFVNLNKTLPDTYLVLVGRGEDEKRLRKLVTTLKAKNVRFFGHFSHDEMPDILNCSDVLVMASFTEGLPTIILEALACGLPIVSTNIGDINNVVENEKIGFLLGHRNEEELKNKLIEALKISDKFEEDRIKIAKNYSADTISKKIIKLHNDLAT